jgi:hypothetical protein
VSTTEVEREPAAPATPSAGHGRTATPGPAPVGDPGPDQACNTGAPDRAGGVRDRAIAARLVDLCGPPWPAGLRLLAPALVYLSVRETGLLVLAWLAARNDVDTTRALTSWDGQWFLGIAGGGYGGVPAGLADAFGRRTPDTALAFFPGYPALVRLLGQVPGVGLVAAGLIVTLISGVVAAYGLHRLGGRVGGSPRVGLILVVLFAAEPMAVVLSMTYSEAAFCALAVWSLNGVTERRWVLAGLCAAGAGLVRPTAAALVVPVIVAAAIAVARRQDGWRPWAGALLAPTGLVGYLAVVGYLTGSPTGWFTLQREGWNSRFDGGLATWRFALAVLANGRSVLEVATTGVLVIAVGLLVAALRQRLPWPLLCYSALVLAMDLGSNGMMNSKARLLVPAFTLLLPAATGLARARRGTLAAVLCGVVLASAWFGGYAITGWQYSI